MGKNDDALTVLRAAVQDLALAGFQTDSVSDAVEAFAELIAADKEYDLAWEAMRFDPSGNCGDWFNAAKSRRATAIYAGGSA